jgi:hypothetical protein
MAVRLSSGGRDKRALDAIESVVIAEKAASLGIAGQRLARALVALSEATPEADREALLDIAADRAYAYLIQRELCGMPDRTQAIADYAIPPAVLARMGAIKVSAPA